MSVDNICKYLSEQDPESFVRWILGEEAANANMLKTELSAEPIRPDFVTLLQPQNRILHVEFQVEAICEPPLPLRMLDYYVRLYRQYRCPIVQCIIFLKRTNSEAAYIEQFVDSNTQTTHPYRVMRLWEQSPAPLLNQPTLLPLAALTQTDTPNTLLEQVASRLDMIEEQDFKQNIAACVEILAGLRFDRNTIRQYLREEVMRESVIYQEILQQGLQQGIQQGKQEGKQEGRQEGRQEEALSYTMRLLTRRIGAVAPELQARIQDLTITKLEELGEALLDFRDASDLTAWLEHQ